jgi:hypothetical protein
VLYYILDKKKDIAYHYFAGILAALDSVYTLFQVLRVYTLTGGHVLIHMAFFSYSFNLTLLLQILSP